MARYEYDVFISYPRRTAISRWVAQVLGPMLEEKLDAAGIGRAPTIFRDEESIEAGDFWDARLGDALAKSRIVIAVLSGPYFESRWCSSEWETACARDAALGLPHSVVIPIRYNDLGEDDIEKLPKGTREQVRSRMRSDLGRFSELVNPLADTQLALDFRTTIRDLCEDAARRRRWIPAGLGSRGTRSSARVLHSARTWGGDERPRHDVL